jgi:hypothetical protein
MAASLQACKARPGKAGKARARQDPTQQITRHISPHLIPVLCVWVRFESARRSWSALHLLPYLRDGRHRRIPGLRHSLENLLPSSGLQLNCDDPGRVRVPAVSPVSQSVSPLSLTIIIILRTLLALLAFSAYTSAYFLVTPNCQQVRAPRI